VAVEADECSLPGTISGATYLGPFTRYRVSADAGGEVFVLAQKALMMMAANLAEGTVNRLRVELLERRERRGVEVVGIVAGGAQRIENRHAETT